jgi:hypothetical protein
MWLSRTAVVALGLLPAAGCSKSEAKYVPVSGVITVNNVPYPNAVVTFQPISTADNPNPGRGSSSFTDNEGRFTLHSDDGHEGAVVGKHRVRIQTRRDNPAVPYNPETGSPDNGPEVKVMIRPKSDPIGLEWYSSDSNKEFDVPRGGTKDANFEVGAQKK